MIELDLYVDKERKDIAVPDYSVDVLRDFLTKEDFDMLDKDARSKGIKVRGLFIFTTRGLHKFGYYKRKIKFKTAEQLLAKILQLHNELAKQKKLLEER